MYEHDELTRRQLLQAGIGIAGIFASGAGLAGSEGRSTAPTRNLSVEYGQDTLPNGVRSRRIDNNIVQNCSLMSLATAKRDLEDFVKKGIVSSKGSGRGAYYELAKKRLITGSNGPSGIDTSRYRPMESSVNHA